MPIKTWARFGQYVFVIKRGQYIRVRGEGGGRREERWGWVWGWVWGVGVGGGKQRNILI